MRDVIGAAQAGDPVAGPGQPGGGAPVLAGQDPRDRYLCGRGTQLYGTPPCQSIGGACLHRAVLGQLFQVLKPASLEATARAMADAEQRHRDQVAAFELALERARFEADRAMRKHNEVEPGNRAGRPHPGSTTRGTAGRRATRRSPAWPPPGPGTRCT